MEDVVDIPASLDRRPNGRRRAWLMAKDACPVEGGNPYDYADMHVDEYLERAVLLDQEEETLPLHTPTDESPPKPIRKRIRARA